VLRQGLRNKATVLGLIVALLVGLAGAASAGTGVRSGDIARPNAVDALQSYWNRRCLDADLNVGDYYRVQMYGCNGWDNQQWDIAGNGHIRSIHFNACLDTYGGGGPYNGMPLQLIYCNGSDSQSWVVNASGYIWSGWAYDVTGGQLWCLDADTNQNWDGGKVQLWQCNQSSNQVWKLI
jgi:hypothetical protein